MGRRDSKDKSKEIKCNRCQEPFDDSHKRDRHRRVCTKIIPNKRLEQLQARRIRRAEAANARFIEEAERQAAEAERGRQSTESVREQLVEKPDEETGEKRFHISIVVIGHVDSGKSTTTGHLVYKLGGIDPCVLERYEKEAADMNRQSHKYAWILDKLKAERERGITIDISLLKFETMKYLCTVIDTPGHRDFIKNMITGASQADCALLVIDSTSGAFEASMLQDGQTREHANLASVLGVKQIICCCNKMDATVPMYSKCRFEEIVNTMTPFLKKVGYKQISFIPISGFEGDNLIERSTNLGWYSGPTLVEAIDLIYEPKRPVNKPLRLPISEVYKIGGIGTVPVGRIATGNLKPKSSVTIAPTGLTTKVKSVEMHGEVLYEAVAGDMIGFSSKHLDTNEFKVKRGDVVSNTKDHPAKGATSFTSQIILLDYPGEIKEGYTPLLHCHTSRSPVRISELKSKIDKKTHEPIESKPEYLTGKDSAVVEMQAIKPLVVEAFDEYPPLGRFAIRDSRQTVAVGVIKTVDKVIEGKDPDE